MDRHRAESIGRETVVKECPKCSFLNPDRAEHCIKCRYELTRVYGRPEDGAGPARKDRVPPEGESPPGAVSPPASPALGGRPSVTGQPVDMEYERRTYHEVGGYGPGGLPGGAYRPPPSDAYAVMTGKYDDSKRSGKRKKRTGKKQPAARTRVNFNFVEKPDVIGARRQPGGKRGARKAEGSEAPGTRPPTPAKRRERGACPPPAAGEPPASPERPVTGGVPVGAAGMPAEAPAAAPEPLFPPGTAEPDRTRATGATAEPAAPPGTDSDRTEAMRERLRRHAEGAAASRGGVARPGDEPEARPGDESEARPGDKTSVPPAETVPSTPPIIGAGVEEPGPVTEHVDTTTRGQTPSTVAGRESAPGTRRKPAPRHAPAGDGYPRHRPAEKAGRRSKRAGKRRRGAGEAGQVPQDIPQVIPGTGDPIGPGEDLTGF